MTRVATVLRYAAFGVMALVGVLGGTFAAGYAFEDPGGWAAVAVTVLYVVPTLALSWLALALPRTAAPVLVGVSVLVLGFSVLDAALGVVPRDAWGPVAAIAVLALGFALACLGLHRPTLAGTLLVLAALVHLVATVLGHRGVGLPGGASPDGAPGLGALLGGSSGVVVVPLLISGLLFLAAGAADHDRRYPAVPPNLPGRHTPRPL